MRISPSISREGLPHCPLISSLEVFRSHPCLHVLWSAEFQQQLSGISLSWLVPMEFSTLSLLLCICDKGHECIHMCEYSFLCYTEHVGRSEDNLRESVFCIFLPCGPKNWTGLSGLMTSTFTHWAILLGPQINFNNSSRNNRDANIQMLITQKQCAVFSYHQPNPNNLSLFCLLKTGLAIWLV